MDMTCLLGRDYHRALAFLARHDWLKLALNTYYVGRVTSIDFPPHDPKFCTKQEYDRVRRLIDFLAETNTQSLFWFAGIGEALLTGPKMFCPTAEQCRALAEVDINLYYSDYEQPYPTMIYKIPLAYQQELREEFKTDDFPKVGMVYHNKEKKFIMAGCQFLNDQITGIFWDSDKTIEERLSLRVYRPKGSHIDVNITEEEVKKMSEDEYRNNISQEAVSQFDLSERLERLCLNFGLILTHYQTQVLPHDPKQFEKLRKMVGSKSPERKEFGQKMLMAEFQEVKLTQEIKFHEDVAERGESGPPTGKQVPAHWRRGHWRHYREERGWKENKRVFIKPIRVHKEWDIGGDTSGTKVIIQG
jgi:hypothetical protein